MAIVVTFSVETMVLVRNSWCVFVSALGARTAGSRSGGKGGGGGRQGNCFIFYPYLQNYVNMLKAFLERSMSSSVMFYNA